MALIRRILSLGRRTKMEQEIDAELREHMAMCIDDNMAQVMAIVAYVPLPPGVEGVAVLSHAGDRFVAIVDKIEDSDYGKFVHILDIEGNKIQLWEPK